MELLRSVMKVQVQRLIAPQRRGRPTIATYDDIFNCVTLLVRTGMQWKYVPSRTVSYVSIFRHAQRWVESGVFEATYKALLSLYQKRRRAKFYVADATYVKNAYGRDCIGRNPTDRGRKATKVTAIVDDGGVALSITAAPANTSDQKLLQGAIAQAFSPLLKGTPLMADKGYDSRSNQQIVRSAQLRDRLFRRKTRISKRASARRIVVENFFSWLDKHRRLLFRFERRVQTFLAYTIFASGQVLASRLAATREGMQGCRGELARP